MLGKRVTERKDGADKHKMMMIAQETLHGIKVNGYVHFNCCYHLYIYLLH